MALDKSYGSRDWSKKFKMDHVWELTASGTPIFDAATRLWRVPVLCRTAKRILPVCKFVLDEADVRALAACRATHSGLNCREGPLLRGAPKVNTTPPMARVVAKIRDLTRIVSIGGGGNRTRVP
jgi:hypothetical protein